MIGTVIIMLIFAKKDLVVLILLKKDDDRIRKEGTYPDWPAWKYYGCDSVEDKRNGLNYLMIFFLDDDNPELIGVITVYPSEKH